MKKRDVIAKLNMFKSVAPKEDWVIKTRSLVLSQIPTPKLEDMYQYTLLEKKSILFYSIKNFLSKYRFAYSLASAFIIFASVLTVSASKNSLPGDPLYSVKIANENVLLAMSSDEDKAKIEVEQAGNRLEELAVISQKLSDSDQHQKVNQLVSTFQEKINNANNRLTKLKNNGHKEKARDLAKVITVKSEKYTEVLAKTSEILSDDLKKNVSDKVAQAITSTEKINSSALLVIAESEGDSDLAVKIQKKIESVDENIKGIESRSSARMTEGASSKLEDVKSKLDKAKEDLEDKNLIEALNSVISAENAIPDLEGLVNEAKIDDNDDSGINADGDKAKDGSMPDVKIDTKKIFEPINPVPVE